MEMALRIAQGRKEREIDPAARALKECVAQAEADKKIDPVALKRLQEMEAFVAQGSKWYEQMLSIPKGQITTLIKMGDKVLSVLKFAGGKKAK